MTLPLRHRTCSGRSVRLDPFDSTTEAQESITLVLASEPCTVHGMSRYLWHGVPISCEVIVESYSDQISTRDIHT